MKRASRNAPQANKPMMAFSPTCRWKGHFERFRRRWGSKHFMKALGSLSERASLGPSSPIPRLARGKRQSGDLACSGGVIRGRCLALLGPIEPFSSTGRGKSESPPPHDCLFLDRQGEKGIAGTPRLPFPRQAGGKGNRKRTQCAHYSLFLDRQEGKGNLCSFSGL